MPVEKQQQQQQPVAAGSDGNRNPDYSQCGKNNLQQILIRDVEHIKNMLKYNCVLTPVFQASAEMKNTFPCEYQTSTNKSWIGTCSSPMSGYLEEGTRAFRSNNVSSTISED